MSCVKGPANACRERQHAGLAGATRPIRIAP
jgi:hypothetical protein